MAQTYTYRPKKLTVQQLLKAAKERHTNLNRFIEEALLDKLSKEGSGPAHVLADKIRGVIVEHMGVRLSKPGGKTAAEIKRKFKKTVETKNWVPDEQVRPHRHRVPRQKG